MSRSRQLQIRRMVFGEPDAFRALRRAGSVLDPRLLEELVPANSSPNPQRSLWGAATPVGIQAAALLAECPGRTALLFLWPVDGPLDDDTAAELAATAAGNAERQRVAMVQCLLEDDDLPQSRGLAAAGFLRLAELEYMQRACVADRPAILPADLTFETYRPALHDLFARTIVASYEQTRDCPGLLGVREIEDVIAGHMAAGRFVPQLWFVVRSGEQGVAVMLINPVDHSGTCELVYFGLALPWRGQGLARVLLELGLAHAGEHRLTQMMLAVDRDNEPAVRLYRSLRFVSTTRRIAWIKSVR